jgi:hypothetical protein
MTPSLRRLSYNFLGGRPGSRCMLMIHNFTITAGREDILTECFWEVNSDRRKTSEVESCKTHGDADLYGTFIGSSSGTLSWF